MRQLFILVIVLCPCVAAGAIIGKGAGLLVVSGYVDTPNGANFGKNTMTTGGPVSLDGGAVHGSDVANASVTSNMLFADNICQFYGWMHCGATPGSQSSAGASMQLAVPFTVNSPDLLAIGGTLTAYGVSLLFGQSATATASVTLTADGVTIYSVNVLSTALPGPFSQPVDFTFQADTQAHYILSFTGRSSITWPGPPISNGPGDNLTDQIDSTFGVSMFVVVAEPSTLVLLSFGVLVATALRCFQRAILSDRAEA